MSRFVSVCDATGKGMKTKTPPTSFILLSHTSLESPLSKVVIIDVEERNCHGGTSRKSIACTPYTKNLRKRTPSLQWAVPIYGFITEILLYTLSMCITVSALVSLMIQYSLLLCNYVQSWPSLPIFSFYRTRNKDSRQWRVILTSVSISHGAILYELLRSLQCTTDLPKICLLHAWILLLCMLLEMAVVKLSERNSLQNWPTSNSAGPEKTWMPPAQAKPQLVYYRNHRFRTLAESGVLYCAVEPQYNGLSILKLFPIG